MLNDPTLKDCRFGWVEVWDLVHDGEDGGHDRGTQAVESALAQLQVNRVEEYPDHVHVTAWDADRGCVDLFLTAEAARQLATALCAELSDPHLHLVD